MTNANDQNSHAIDPVFGSSMPVAADPAPMERPVAAAKPVVKRASAQRWQQPRPHTLLVVMAITVVAVAFGLGLYVQVGVSFWTSQLAALTLFIAAVAGHLLKRRDEQVRAMTTKLSVLERQVAELRGPTLADAAPSLPVAAPSARMHTPVHPQPVAAPAEPPLAPAPTYAAPLEPIAPLPRSAPPRKPDYASAESQVRAIADALAHGPAEITHRTHPAPAARIEDQLANSIAALNAVAGTVRTQPSGPLLAPAPQAASQPAAPPQFGRTTAPRDMALREPAPREHGSVRVAAPARPVSNVVAEAVAADRIDVYLQPILGLADRQVRYFEVSARLRDEAGNVLKPAEFTPQAKAARLMPRIDGAMLKRTAKLLSWLETRGRLKDVFSRLSAEALADPAFMLETGEYALEARERAQHLVLSFSQSSLREFDDAHWDSLSILHELGFKFALEEIQDLESDFEVLRDRGFAFAKLAAAVFLEGMQFEDVVVPANDLATLFPEMGLMLIVSDVLDDRSVASLIAHGVELGQGALFAEAKPVKADVLNNRAA